ncbi:MAG: hypothetical protein LAT77_10435 [Aliidiomarina sp.]|uniref:hypothetical protein n=1 Tax=Aliidiomarina sp. TaxID=1872439 RepID=UPI0025C59ECF|nr:hypothetical protein [Aliidiomarina sp.]MCH8502312.1 hypothetical protein [Aliidiomarina sp.]
MIRHIKGTSRKTTVALLSTFFSLSAFAQEVDIPHQFSPSTPAKAEEVNENFAFLGSRLAEVLERFEASPADNHVFQKYVNCAENPYGLRDAYAEGLEYTFISLVIEGACYGNFKAGVGAKRGQHIQLTGVAATGESNPRIIPEPISQRTNLFSVDGGLYLYRLQLEMGENDSNGVFFANNATGILQTVTISGRGISAGIRATEGASVRVVATNIDNFDFGISGINAANFQISDVLITSVNTGIDLNNSTVQQNGDVEVHAAQFAAMINTSSWNNWDSQLMTLGQGSIHLNRGSTYSARYLVNQSHISINASNVIVSEHITANSLSANRQSFLELGGGTIAAKLDVGRNATVDLNNVTTNDVAISDYATLRSRDSTYQGNLQVNSASASFEGSVSIDLSRVRCTGFSHIDMQSVDWLNDHPETRCLTSTDVYRLYDVFRDALIN